MNIHEFITSQLACWPDAALRRKDLDDRVVSRTIEIDGHTVVVQHNPARAVSTGAVVDAAAIASRPCFLCQANRPEEQRSIPFGRYEILVNPFPIFPDHLTIADRSHCEQRIAGRIGDMLQLGDELRDFTIFYNGPKCGASAPDHAHFQAAPSEYFPIWSSIDISQQNPEVTIAGWLTGVVVITSACRDDVERNFISIMKKLPAADADIEPMVNLLVRKVDDCYQLAVIPRRSHRPAEYGTGAGQMMISPASIDMAGVFVLPRRMDYDTISGTQLKSIIQRTGYSAAELNLFISPVISVGIMESERLSVDLHGEFMLNNSRIICDRELEISAEVLLRPLSADSRFTIRDVMIGIDFHWQQRQNQTFEGELSVEVSESGKLLAINRLPIERYIFSVISSEMNAEAPLEFLKAHAVISRSWALAQVRGGDSLEKCAEFTDDDSEIVRWYDHAAHTRFDVCADDHCQRYQGVPKKMTPQVAQAVEATAGQVLTHKGMLCDARFSKCCGGVTERFSTCWQPVDFAYLPAITDTADATAADLSAESDARQWILSTPDAFCSNPTPQVMEMVLNSYDRSTPHLYRWMVSYTAEELSEIIRTRSGVDYGRILALEPLHRGPSGRIDRLRIVGSSRTRIIGKELEIRRTLSRSHLYSSAFVVETGECDSQGVPQRWTLHGAGWGHGVGLCQIGAAVMATKGYDYRQILAHYFPGSNIEPIRYDE